jgi:hypothetical protein
MKKETMWSSELFPRWAQKRKLPLTKETYLTFHNTLLQLEAKGKLQFAQAGCQFRPKNKITRNIAQWQKELLREKKSEVLDG